MNQPCDVIETEQIDADDGKTAACCVNAKIRKRETRLKCINRNETHITDLPG